MALPFGLLAGDREVGTRRVHVHGGGGPGPQELVVDRSHATADVEDGLPFDTARGEPIDQRASQVNRAVLAVGTELLGCVAGVELAIVRGLAR